MLFRLYQCNFQTQLVSDHFENGSQVLSPLRDPRSTVNYTNKLLIQWVQKLLAIATYASLHHDLLLLEA